MIARPRTIAPPRTADLFCASALLGGAIWSIALLLVRPAPSDPCWARAVLTLAPLVLVPLGLRLIAAPTASQGVNRLTRVSMLLQLPSALAFGAAFLLPQGLSAAALALPWLALSGLLALLGLIRL